MAKKQYALCDLEGRIWTVRPGDPAFPLVSTLRHPTPHLPANVIRSGQITEVDLWDAERRVERATKLSVANPDDAEFAVLLIRTVSAHDSLKMLSRNLMEATNGPNRQD